MVREAQARALERSEQTDAIKTWRYLRLVMIGLVGGLLASVAYEYWKVEPNCIQTSISAYYYTPVRGYFVGALVAIGVCLVCLKGSTEEEDTLLNLAGLFALIVALVPTPGTGDCASMLGSVAGRDANIANNVTALLIVGLVALVSLALASTRDPASKIEILAYAAAALTWAVAAYMFWEHRPTFVEGAHYTAAVLMFVCIFVVVWINALGYRDENDVRRWRNPYFVVACAMAASSAIIGIAGLSDWEYWVIAIEGALILLFALFWIAQTVELWNRGLRPQQETSPQTPT